MTNLSPLSFYSSLKEQNHRRNYAYDAVFPLVAHRDYFMPFQFVLPGTVAIGTVTLHDVSGTQVKVLTSAMKTAGLTATTFDGYTVFSFPSRTTASSLGLPIGNHYLKINGLVSEVFTVVSNANKFLQLVWRNEEDIIYNGGRLLYSTGYANRLLLDTQLGKPDYRFEEEGEERDGFFFPEKQISEKVYKFTFLAPEYLLDALRLVRLSDHVSIVDTFGKVHKCDTILLTPRWQTQGDIASVGVEFETGTVIKRLGNGASADIVTGTGDFNVDYNEDYYI